MSGEWVAIAGLGVTLGVLLWRASSAFSRIETTLRLLLEERADTKTIAKTQNEHASTLAVHRTDIDDHERRIDALERSG